MGHAAKSSLLPLSSSLSWTYKHTVAVFLFSCVQTINNHKLLLFFFLSFFLSFSCVQTVTVEKIEMHSSNLDFLFFCLTFPLFSMTRILPVQSGVERFQSAALHWILSFLPFPTSKYFHIC